MQIQSPEISEKITISSGAAEAESTIDSLEALMGKGDQTMYLAKRNGRNRVCSAEEM